MGDFGLDYYGWFGSGYLYRWKSYAMEHAPAYGKRSSKNYAARKERSKARNAKRKGKK